MNKLFYYIILSILIQGCLSQLPGSSRSKEVYFGSAIGKLTKYSHEVSGEVYAVDESTLFIKNFNYDGQGPQTFFLAGNSVSPDDQGFIIPDDKGSTKSLSAYSNQNIVLRLPEGKTLRDINWLSIWCREFKVNFGDIPIPKNLDIPSPVEIPALSRLAHDVRSGPITIVDAQTFLIPNFHYDGEGPAAYWWVTRGPRQGPNGLRLKDENGSPAPLRRYSGETVVISLPDDKTIYDYDWLGVWCEQFNVDFGHIRIPQHIRVPPSPKMLGIKPETKLNCEVLHDDLGYEIRWVMDGDDIVMQLVGKIEPNEYMSFGLSKDDSKSEMINSDAVVSWVGPNGDGRAVDYFLGSKEQCVGNRGSCPDVKHRGATDSVTLLHAAIVNGFSMVTFKRPQLGLDEQYDQHIYSDGPQAVMWAIGPLNDRQETSYHRLHNNGDMFIDFARTPKWNCPLPDDSVKSIAAPGIDTNSNSAPTARPQLRPQTSEPSVRPQSRPQTEPQSQPQSKPQSKPQLRPGEQQPNSNAWKIPAIVCPSDTTLRAQIGPTGGSKGYSSITGKVGWGIAWYINGLLIPEITLQRGKTYTFIVEGGNDKNNSARRHPLYLSDDPEGGFDYKSDDQRQNEQIFGGVGITSDGTILPTAEGRLCEWKIDTKSKRRPEDYNNFFEFQRSLSLDCAPGNSGVLRFTPDQNTPDLIYYHCYTHRNLGWKIHIVDNCDNNLFGQSSIPKISVLKPDINGNKEKANNKESNRPSNDNSDVIFDDKVLEGGHVYFPDLKRNPKNSSRSQVSKPNSGSNRAVVTQKPFPKPHSTSYKPIHSNLRPHSQSNVAHKPSPKPVPQIPAPAQYVPLSLPPLAPQAYQGPPPYLFSYQPPPQPRPQLALQSGPFINYPLGPIKSFEHVFRPPQPTPLPNQGLPLGLPQSQSSQSSVQQSSPVDNLHTGFVPMLIKTANQSIVKHFELQSQTKHNPNQNLNINSNPFSKNSSVPFSPTFRAPNPDYSGFNISRYGELSPGSSKLSAQGLRPIQLNKPLVPLKVTNKVKPEKVNIPLRYRLKGQNSLLEGNAEDSGATLPHTMPYQTSNVAQNPNDVYKQYLDSVRNDFTKDETDYMIAVERGSQSAESQSNPAIVDLTQQDFTKLNNAQNKMKNNSESKVYGQRTKPIITSQPTTVHNIEVVDESPLKSEQSVSPKTTSLVPLTKEQLKNKTDHTILNDVLRMIAQNAPAIAPQLHKDHGNLEVRTIRSKRGANYHNKYDRNGQQMPIPMYSVISTVFTIILILM